jgi:thioredoxin-related protein
VLFEQAQCLACDELHDEVLTRREVAVSLSNLDVAQLDLWSQEQIQTPDGRQLAAQDWMRELGIQYTPSLLLFDAEGREVFRAEAYLKAFHVQGALDYVATGAYRHEPNFQRFLHQRGDTLRARGIVLDMMD